VQALQRIRRSEPKIRKKKKKEEQKKIKKKNIIPYFCLEENQMVREGLVEEKDKQKKTNSLSLGFHFIPFQCNWETNLLNPR
jgi:hypothetical protein